MYLWKKHHSFMKSFSSWLVWKNRTNKSKSLPRRENSGITLRMNFHSVKLGDVYDFMRFSAKGLIFKSYHWKLKVCKRIGQDACSWDAIWQIYTKLLPEADWIFQFLPAVTQASAFVKTSARQDGEAGNKLRTILSNQSCLPSVKIEGRLWF